MGINRTAPSANDLLDEDDDLGLDDLDLDEDEEPQAKPTARKAPAKKTAAKPAAKKDDLDEDEILDEEDEDERPSRSSTVQSGWGSANAAIKAGSKGFVNDFKWDEEIQVVKFLEGDPIAIFDQHWVNEIAQGRKSFACIGEAKCPLCKAGHSPDKKIAFCIVNFSQEEGPAVQMLTVGPRLAGQFKAQHDNPKTGPLDGSERFWALSSSGKGNKKSYSIVPIKARDLAEDWSLVPSEVQEFLDEAEALTSKAIRFDDLDTLREVVKDHL